MYQQSFEELEWARMRHYIESQAFDALRDDKHIQRTLACIAKGIALDSPRGQRTSARIDREAVRTAMRWSPEYAQRKDEINAWCNGLISNGQTAKPKTARKRRAG